MSRDLGRDVPDFENLMQENFGQIFRSLLSGPDIFRWGGALPREGVRAEKFADFSMSFETQGSPTFWQHILLSVPL